MRQPCMFSSFSFIGDRSANFPEVIPHFLDEKLRLLERREMAALRHLAPMRDVGIARLHPLAHRRHDLLGEYRDTGRYFYGVRSAVSAQSSPNSAAPMK